MVSSLSIHIIFYVVTSRTGPVPGDSTDLPRGNKGMVPRVNCSSSADRVIQVNWFMVLFSLFPGILL